MNPATPIVHVVDDDESFRLAVGRLLRAAGYRVQTYPSGTDFLNSGSTHGPGCLLLDMKMPGSDGLELQTALTDGELSLPIIFISGRSNISTKAHSASWTSLGGPPAAHSTLRRKDTRLSRTTRRWNSVSASVAVPDFGGL